MIEQSVVQTLFNGVLINSTSPTTYIGTGGRTYHTSIAGTGVVSGTVTWYGTNNSNQPVGVVLAISQLSGTTTDTTGGYILAEWPYMYAIITNITGTAAAITASVGQ